MVRLPALAALTLACLISAACSRSSATYKADDMEVSVGAEPRVEPAPAPGNAPDVPPGLAKKGGVPPGLAKKGVQAGMDYEDAVRLCGEDVIRVRVEDGNGTLVIRDGGVHVVWDVRDSRLGEWRERQPRAPGQGREGRGPGQTREGRGRPGAQP